MAEPAPDDHQRDAVVGKLDGVRVAQLVRGEAAPAAAAVSRSGARAAAIDQRRRASGR